MACSVLSVAKCLLCTIYYIFDTQENERLFDDTDTGADFNYTFFFFFFFENVACSFQLYF